MSIRFRHPTGEDEEIEGVDSVVEHVLHDGSEFWNIGSGDAALERGSRYNPISLELYFDRRDRFQVRHVVPGEYPAIAQDPTGGGEEAVINVGGTPMTLEAKTLLSRDDAVRIVRHFFETGEKLPDFKWH